MIFLGLLFDRQEEKQIAAKSRNGVLQNQVNTFQWNCIDGFYENDVQGLRIINALPVGVFPHQYKAVYLPAKEWMYHGDKHHQIASPNVPFLKQFFRRIHTRKSIQKSGDKDIVIYSPYLPFLQAIKNLDSTYKVTLIVPDLPAHYDYGSTNVLRKWLRKLNNRAIEKCLKRVDRFVLLTDAMKEPLHVGDRPYTVVEGICSSKTPVQREAHDKKVILYTGSLNRKFGIDVLMEAFSKISNLSYEMWICGGGDYEETIRRMAQNDKRITFFGYVSKEKALELQSKATVLVNPRQNNEEYTKYSFPSKTMEYLLSGVPVIAYKLSGIPDEYDAYLNYVPDNTAKALCEMLTTVCEDTMGAYTEKATSAVSFLMTEKTPKKQAEKILRLMQE